MYNDYAIEKALKTVFLPVICNELDAGTNPIFSKIKQSVNDVWGNEVIVTTAKENILLKSNMSKISLKLQVPLRNFSLTPADIAQKLGKNIEKLKDDFNNYILHSLFSKKENSSNFLTGFADVLDTDNEKIYNVAKADYCSLNPVCKKVNEFNLNNLIEMVDDLEQNRSRPNFILCSYDTKRKLYNELLSKHNTVNVIEFSSGHKAIDVYMGIPLLPIKDLKDEEMYFIDTTFFTLHQLCDWNWEEDGKGNILHRDTKTGECYALLVKYAEIICDDISKQGVLKKFTESDLIIESITSLFLPIRHL